MSEGYQADFNQNSRQNNSDEKHNMNLTTSPQPGNSRQTASKALNRRLRKNHQVPEDQLVFTESAGLESRSKKDVFTNRSQYIVSKVAIF
jgi:hypothetical protein